MFVHRWPSSPGGAEPVGWSLAPAEQVKRPHADVERDVDQAYDTLQVAVLQRRPEPETSRGRLLRTAEIKSLTPAAHPDQLPNQRCRRVAANSSFSAARSAEGPRNGAVGAGPDKKSASTLPTKPPPNSM